MVHTAEHWEVYEAHGCRDNVRDLFGHIASCEFEEHAPIIAAAPDLLLACKTAPKPMVNPSAEWINAYADWFNMVRNDAVDKTKPE